MTFFMHLLYNNNYQEGGDNMQFVKERLGKWIQAAIILTVGILCIVAGALIGGKDGSAAQDALDGISVVLGVVLIVVGSLSVILAVVVAVLAKKGFAAVAIPGALLVALGASLCVTHYAAELIGILLVIIPYLLLALGVVVLADAVFTFVMACIQKKMKEALVGFIVAVVIGVVAIVLGALCVGNDPVIKSHVQLIVFGIVVCLVACLLVVLTFVKLPDAVAVVVTKKEEPKEEKAE